MAVGGRLGALLLVDGRGVGVAGSVPELGPRPLPPECGFGTAAPVGAPARPMPRPSIASGVGMLPSPSPVRKGVGNTNQFPRNRDIPPTHYDNNGVTTVHSVVEALRLAGPLPHPPTWALAHLNHRSWGRGRGCRLPLPSRLRHDHDTTTHQWSDQCSPSVPSWDLARRPLAPT